jgi:hypothetical protein
MRVGLGTGGLLMAVVLQGCQAQSVSMTDFWRAQCAQLGYETGSRKMTVCVSEMRGEAEADMFSAVAVY